MQDLQYCAVSRCQNRVTGIRDRTTFRVPEKKDDKKKDNARKNRDEKGTSADKKEGHTTTDNYKRDTFFCHRQFVVNS